MTENRLSSPPRALTYSKYDIARYIDEKGKTRWSHLVKEFVENDSERQISQQTLSHYIQELCNEGLVTKTIDKKAFLFKQYWRVYPIYVIPKNRKKRMEEIRQNQEIYEYLDSANIDKIKKLSKDIRSLY